MDDRLDIVLFGATGFTGIHCIPYLAKFSRSNNRNLSWGIAGRSEEKLRNALKDMEKKLEISFESVPLIIADVNNYESLVEMAKKARLVINCCGPYRLLGEAVVKACLEAGTHHIDVSGEPEYMELIQIEHDDVAKEKGVYIISACGLDSIPADMGIIYTQQNFEGTLNSVETFITAWNEGSSKGSTVNYGTWETLVHSMANRGELRNLRKRYYEKYKQPPTFLPKLNAKRLPHLPKFVKGWAVPFLGADRSVARRSQGYLYKHENIRPVQVETYLLLPSFLVLIILVFSSVLFLFLSRFEFGRRLLLEYPGFFSFGFFSKEAPSEEKINNTWFSIDLYGEGWKEKLTSKDDQYSTQVDRFIQAKVRGQNPGYGATCLAVVLAGIVLLSETEKLANKGHGGVYPPGAAFAKTSLVNQLHENGLSFEILAQGDIKRNA